MKRPGKLLAAWLVCGFLTCWTRSAMAQGSLPDGPGKEAIQAACTVCHGLDMITNTNRSLSAWEDTVSDMMARGAPLLEGEREVVIQYLANHFGPKSSKVNINRASAKEIETTFALSAKEAEEIVRYREQNGNFREWEDLKKIPGIDLKKIEAKKDRVAF